MNSLLMTVTATTPFGKTFTIHHPSDGGSPEYIYGTEESAKRWPELNFLLCDHIDSMLEEFPEIVLDTCEAYVTAAEEDILPPSAPAVLGEDGTTKIFGYQMRGQFFGPEIAGPIITMIEDGRVPDMKVTVRAWLLGQLGESPESLEENDTRFIHYLRNYKEQLLSRTRKTYKKEPSKTK